MIFVQQLLQNKQYKIYLSTLEALEKDRIYCKHSFEHFLDVARIGVLIAYENKLKIDKEAFYLTALLHDLGRVDEYQSHIPHEKASIALAEILLNEINYPKESQKEILDAISKHREKSQDITSLSGLLAKADKLARNCFFCKASASCYWAEDKKNKTILY